MSEYATTHHLKQTTNIYSTLIEAALLAQQRTIPIPQYKQLLFSFYGFYAPIEARLKRLPWQIAPIHFDFTCRSELLEADLYALGENKKSLATFPRCRSLPSLMTLAQGLGALYVLEHAVTEGRIFIQPVQRHPDVRMLRAARFFSTYNQEQKVRLQKLNLLINLYGGSETYIQAAILNAANSTFAALHHWLTEESLLHEQASPPDHLLSYEMPLIS